MRHRYWWWLASAWRVTGFGDGHPFGPDRHAAFFAEFAARGLDKRVRIMETRAATRDELRVLPHAANIVDLVAERSLTGEGYLDAGDTPAWRGVYEAAADVVGATLLAADEIMAGRARRAFVPIAGLHHAARGGGGGLLRVQRLRRGGGNASAQSRLEAHCLRGHRCAPRRRRVSTASRATRT